jgi:hypothetical protein
MIGFAFLIASQFTLANGDDKNNIDNTITPLKELLPNENDLPEHYYFIDDQFYAWSSYHLTDNEYLVEHVQRGYLDPTYGPEIFMDRYSSKQAAHDVYEKYVQTYSGLDLGNGCSDVYHPQFQNFTAVVCNHDEIILVIYDFMHQNFIKDNLLPIALHKVDTKIDQKNIEENKCELAEPNYTMENGRILGTCYEKDTVTLTMQIEADSDDQLIIDIPKQLVYSFEDVDCEEGQMIILMDGEVIEPAIVSSKTANTITIDVQEGIHQIEFIGTTPVPNPSPAMYCGIVMGYDTQYLPPRLQLELGMSPELVRCNQGLELAIKTSDGNPVCVTPSTKSKLVERDLIEEKMISTLNENDSEPSTLIFGSDGIGNGQFRSPGGIAIDSVSNIYVVDSVNPRIQKFSQDGVYQSQFGSEGSDPGEFNYPYDIAIDSADNIYVTDGVNNRIQKFDSEGAT